MSQTLPPFVHVVLFTVKPATPDDRIDAQVADAYTLLATIPTVRHIQSGRREQAMQREVNNREFEIGLVVHFDDKAGHDVYAAHETHLAYVEKHKAIWAKVEVSDFVAR